MESGIYRGCSTLVSAGKKRRLTLIECGNDLNTMMDVAKIADLVSPFITPDQHNKMECQTGESSVMPPPHDTHTHTHTPPHTRTQTQVLLLVDASFGFEMETFEFLNVLQVHGFPRVMGVLTHLDLLRSTRTQRRVKKSLKQRFWTEIYQVWGWCVSMQGLPL